MCLRVSFGTMLLFVPQTRRCRAVSCSVPRACLDQLEEPSFQVGQRVEGLYGASKLGVSFGCRWFSGAVTNKGPDGSFDVQYEDGEREERVLPRYMRLPGAAPPASPPASGEDEGEGEGEDEPSWIVSLRARAAASSERRVRTLRSLATSLSAWSNCPPWNCPSSAPAPPQGAARGPVRLGTPRVGPGY